MFNLERDQIAQHLAALGYKSGDPVYLRSFYPSDDPRKLEDKGRSAEIRNLKQLIRTASAWQADGRGVYFVVNGGGHSDKDVTNCRAIFYEHDNLDKELQRELWRSLELPEPSLQIDTGGKSIHSYWIFNEPISPEQWRTLQTDLLEYADADRSLKNPSRVMRLAGCWHFAPNNVPNEICQIILNSQNRYSYESLRAIIPQQSVVTPSIPLYISSDQPIHDREFITANLFDDVPLECCLTKADRALIDGGMGQGERNSKGAALARNLIGTAMRLVHLGHRFSGDPRILFDEYCARCSPPLDAREAETIWKSAQKDNPTATLTDDALENCIKSWQRQQPAYSQQARVNGSKNQSVTGDSTKVGDSSNPVLSDITSTVTTVTQILQSGLTDYEETQKLESVLNSSVVKNAAFKQLVSSVRSQLDDVQPSDEIRLDNLINWHNAKLDFNQALPSMAADLLHDAEILNIEPIVIWQPLMASVLSLVGKRLKLNVESHNVPAIAWTATVLESGGGKTRADSLVLTPIKRKQIEARRHFEQEVEAYQNWQQGDTDERPPYPTERKYMFEMATIQAVIKRLSEQKDNGVLWARDELAGLFKSFGQFGKGENEGLECLLKLWDGAPAQVDRVSQVDSYVVEETALSLTGGIQPGMFRKIFKDPEDSQGMLARFLVAKANALMPRRVKGYCVLADKLPPFYDWLENCPMGVVKLSKSADAYYTKLCQEIGRQAWATTQPAIRAWMFKLPTQLLRIALALHLIECYGNPNCNFWQIETETLSRAVLFAQYYKSAFQVVTEMTTESDDISSVLLKIWDAAVTKHVDGISTRDAYRNIKMIGTRAKEAFRNVSAYTAELFSKLERMGKGTVVKIGRQIKFIANFPSEYDPPPEEASEHLCACAEGKEFIQVLSSVPPPLRSCAQSSDRVTIAENHELQAIEPSPTSELSPVTVPNNGNYPSNNVVIEATHFPEIADNTQDDSLELQTNQSVDFAERGKADHSNQCSPVVETASSQPQADVPTPEITKGLKVQVHFPGSKRHEKQGVVARLVYEHGVKKAVVILENIEASLKHFLCPLPGTDLMRLEVIQPC
ncbi:DUF3987 domain-containing protein [Komarekiella sp. 'clone 1']|uniref:DUF3987 domain-containing protein n=1 Tax=Komarekiella delphini-convector SJRDD-AB1 TaxID=2593771 RepID=A0AA40VUG5_9NOST|nr:DUF3987 domain-containing protein [Komarekiella delphini-convector]MBD6620159.1 DUF3987 domain-containing protein [Komarekiella delphini-convector SJRDD-AB1]